VQVEIRPAIVPPEERSGKESSPRSHRCAEFRPGIWLVDRVLGRKFLVC